MATCPQILGDVETASETGGVQVDEMRAEAITEHQLASECWSYHSISPLDVASGTDLLLGTIGML